MVCPICKKPISDSPPDKWFPFCSERCKLIDLGRWLGGKYQIPVTDPDDDTPAPGPAPHEDD